jgi:pimeloyl-ACP methyl ester carboxylesterase
MANYVLIHGAGGVGWNWHLVARELEQLGHETVAPDFPIDDETATLNDYAAVLVRAVGTIERAIVVAHSFGGYTAPIVATRIPTDLIVLVAGMVPVPGESAADVFEHADFQREPQDDSSDFAFFFHDVPHELALEAQSRGRDQAYRGLSDPFPLDAWPAVPTRAIIGTQDRMFPPWWLRKVTNDRLGITPDEIDAGHCIILAKPRELAQMLERYRVEIQG